MTTYDSTVEAAAWDGRQPRGRKGGAQSQGDELVSLSQSVHETLGVHEMISHSTIWYSISS